MKSLYYTPYISRKKSPTGKLQKAKGKLVYKAQNLRKTPFELCKIANNPDVEEGDLEEDEELGEEELEKLQPSIDWLKNYEEPWDAALKHWKLTSSYRKRKVGEDKSKLISQIYLEWPILRTPKGFELIDLDFKLGGYTENLEAIKNFQTFFTKFIDVKRPKHNHEYVNTLKDLLLDENLNESK